MTDCSIRAPEGSDGPSSRGYSRPILFVKYHGAILAYAKYLDGEYVFEASEDMCAAIGEGSLDVSFQFDDDIPIGIVLTDGTQPGPEESGIDAPALGELAFE